MNHLKKAFSHSKANKPPSVSTPVDTSTPSPPRSSARPSRSSDPPRRSTSSVPEPSSSSHSRHGSQPSASHLPHGGQHSISSQASAVDTGSRKQIKWSIDGQSLDVTFNSVVGQAVRTVVPISLLSWADRDTALEDELLNFLGATWIIPKDARISVLTSAGKIFRDWRYKLRHNYMDKYNTVAQRKANKPPEVRQEDWDKYVELVSTPEYEQMRGKMKANRSLLISPHRSGRTGGAITAARVREKNPDASRDDFFLAVHGSEDDQPLPHESAEMLTQVKEKLEENPALRRVSLDHDAVAQVYGPDGHGQVRGLGGGVTKTRIESSRGYRERYIRRDAEARTLEQRETQATHPSETSQDIPFTDPLNRDIDVQIGPCVFLDMYKNQVAFARVVGAVEGSTFQQCTLECIIDQILSPNTPVFAHMGNTLDDYSSGDTIDWPAYFLTYL